MRSDGYAIVDQELELGLRSVAIPVFNSKGEVMAAINIGAQAARVPLDHIRTDFVPRLRHVQDQLRRLIQADTGRI